MNRYKVQAFFKEFPFLAPVLELVEEGGDHGPQTVLSPEYVEEVKVSRIDRGFLEVIPKRDGATGSLVGIRNHESILLFDEKGEVIKEVMQAIDIIHNEAYREDEKEEGETVGEALAEIEDPNTVAYAVCIHTGYRIRDHHSVGGYSITLYKPPKGFTLKEWVEEQERRAKEMLDAQLAEIDAEA
ncbi:MAG: hypothetical protein HQ579_05045 [Candidatus Omnitrophica bacterium]|nr:hypothetical protein [Candidatus Omnitrophota bacterium]